MVDVGLEQLDVLQQLGEELGLHGLQLQIHLLALSPTRPTSATFNVCSSSSLLIVMVVIVVFIYFVQCSVFETVIDNKRPQ